MSEVTLTRAECEALEREARSHLEMLHAQGLTHSERANSREDYRRSFLACADLIGELEWARRRWRQGEWTATVTLGPEVEAWLRRRRAEIEGHVRGMNRGEAGHGAREAFLLRVLDRLADEAIAA